MAEIRTVTTLRRKRDEIVSAVKLYEQKLAQAQADLSHVLAAIRIFEASGDPKEIPRYMDLHRLFARGETWALCKASLTAKGALTTKDLAADLMKAKGLQGGDRVLEIALGQKLVNSLIKQELRGQVVREGKRKGVVVWRLPSVLDTSNGRPDTYL